MGSVLQLMSRDRGLCLESSFKRRRPSAPISSEDVHYFANPLGGFELLGARTWLRINLGGSLTQRRKRAELPRQQPVSLTPYLDSNFRVDPITVGMKTNWVELTVMHCLAAKRKWRTTSARKPAGQGTTNRAASGPGEAGSRWILPGNGRVVSSLSFTLARRILGRSGGR